MKTENINLSEVEGSIYEEIKNQLQDENYDFDKEIEVTVSGTTFYTKISGCVIIMRAWFDGSYDCPPDAPTTSVHIKTINPITYMDDEDNEIVLDIDTEKLMRILNINLSD